MADFGNLKQHPIWQKNCQLFKTVLAVCSECAGQGLLEEISRKISKCTAEGIVSQNPVFQKQQLEKALELARQVDQSLYELAEKTYKTHGKDNGPLYEKMIKSFVLADQFKEMLFTEIKLFSADKCSA